jgi:ribosomal protein L11 methyltransferase
VLAELLELVPGGVEEVELPGDVIEYGVYGAPGELPALPALTAAAGEALVEIRTEEIGEDWQERWREFHRPLVLGSSLTVRPPWEPAGATPIEVVIDPGRAFGTGAHATTRLCLELLLELADEAGARGSFVDLGCGSGVLAIAAAKLGFSPVLALDNEPAAVEATAANARVNQVQLEARRLDLRSDSVPVAGMVAANLLAPLLILWAKRLGSDRLAPGGVIASGLLRGQEDEVSEAFARIGLGERKRRAAGDWAALLLESTRARGGETPEAVRRRDRRSPRSGL